jgi:hypothetical protein
MSGGCFPSASDSLHAFPELVTATDDFRNSRSAGVATVGDFGGIVFGETAGPIVSRAVGM